MIVSNTLNGSKQLVLAQIVELTQDAVIVTDEDHNIVVFNEGATNMFGYQPEEVMDGPLNKLLPEDFQHAHTKHMERFNEEHDGGYRECAKSRMMRLENEHDKGWTMCGVRKNGQLFEIEATISKITYNEHSYFAAIVRDVSERYKLLDQMRQRDVELAAYRRAQKAMLLDELQEAQNLKLSCEL